VGAATSSLFTLLLFERPLERLFGGPAAFIGVAAVTVAALFAAGASFAWLGNARPKQRVLVGLTLVGIMFVGLLLVLAFEPIGIRTNPLLTFRIAFVAASAAIGFGATALTAWLLGTRGWLSAALLVAIVTAASYLMLVVAVDPLPGWRVGGGQSAMLKVAALGNFVAGVAGATVAHRLLTSRRA
jgi:hypothetical protein